MSSLVNLEQESIKRSPDRYANALRKAMRANRSVRLRLLVEAGVLSADALTKIGTTKKSSKRVVARSKRSD